MMKLEVVIAYSEAGLKSEHFRGGAEGNYSQSRSEVRNLDVTNMKQECQPPDSNVRYVVLFERGFPSFSSVPPHKW
jgi:hypothetical protein